MTLAVRSVGVFRTDDPNVEALARHVLSASEQSGVPAGYYTNTPAEAEMRVAQGFRMVFLGHDMVQLPSAFQEMKQCSQDLARKVKIG
jgi:2-keto-3-deoxy-L-rhamnonate aldolase RhmA